MIRTNPENHLLHYKQLLNQFIVDMYAKIENERLRYIRCNQKALKVEQYINLKDAFENDENVSDIGQKCILPASFIGSPRHMHEYIQDALVTLDIMESHVYSLHLHVIFDGQKSPIYCWLISNQVIAMT
ncbi:unnamed protein product [Macrosiphum euphorbiae]|uniref:Helitron helicase-like domain-containing protein n=2 Tax=Macrosiphum euphorbiae TaxID=13131 RepID=A0AAV0XT95_9HEMI|nr:unnamed protein product [Macrosiphum euphorbiae]